MIRRKRPVRRAVRSEPVTVRTVDDDLAAHVRALRGDEAARAEYRALRRAPRPVLVLEALVRSRGVNDPLVARTIVRRVLDTYGGLPADDVASSRRIITAVAAAADAQAAIR